MSLFKNRPLARICLFFLLGALFAYFIHTNGMLRELALVPLFLLLSLLLIFFLFRKKTGILLVFSIFSLLLGYFSQLIYDRICYTDVRNLDSGRIHHVEAEIVSVESLASTKSICTLSISSLNGEEASGKLKLTVYNRNFIPKAAEIIECDVMILTLADDDLYQNGIAAHVTTESSPSVIGKKDHPIRETVIAWRARLCERLYDGMSEKSAALLSAVLLGERDGLSTATTTAFKRAGLSHLLALSGLHLSVMAMLLLGFFRKIGTPRAFSFLALLILVSFYALIAGFPLSLVRAAGMLLLAEIGRLLRLSSDSVTALFASIAVIVLLSPTAIVDLGLALSFLATLGIVTASELFEKRQEHRSRLRSIIGKVTFTVLITLAATLFTLLLSILVFKEISILSPLSNLVLSPILYILLLIAPLALAFPTVFDPIVSILTDATNGIISFFSAIPWSYISASYPAFVTVAVLFSILLLFLLIDTHVTKRILKRCLLSGITVLIITLVSCHLYTASTDYLSYNRISESECLLLQSDRTVTVVANGGNAYTAKKIKWALSDQHITVIDTLIIPNVNKDTPLLIAELADIMLIQKIVLCPAPAIYIEAAIDTVVDKGIEIIRMQNGTSTFPGELTATVLGDLGLSQNGDSEFFLRLEYRNTGICYAPAGALAIADEAARKSFTKHADIIIVGAAPSFSGKFDAEGISKDAAIIIGSTRSAPSALIERENSILEPEEYRFTLQ